MIFTAAMISNFHSNAAVDLLLLPFIGATRTDGVGISSCCRPRVLAEPRSPQARYIIMYFHCNGVDLGMCKGFCNVLRRQFRVHVCLDK